MEELINRVRLALGAGASREEIVKELERSGVSKEDVFLAIESAKILDKEEVK